jgi:hypothetical protein
MTARELKEFKKKVVKGRRRSDMREAVATTAGALRADGLNVVEGSRGEKNGEQNHLSSSATPRIYLIHVAQYCNNF